MFLNPIECQRLTSLFKATGGAVWGDDRIKTLLLDLSFGKCAYCECNLTTEGKYLEVEHFACKGDYPDEVIDWNNLLPSCKRCNTTKGTHDVKKEPIVNPFEDLPSAHFSFAAYRFRPTTKKGEMTSAVVGLNHHSRAVTMRFEIGEQIQASVDNSADRLSAYLDSPTNLRCRKLKESVEGLLRESLPAVPYAATAATVLHKHSPYSSLKSQMEAHGLWDAHLQALHEESIAICL
jgi:hypothetical protein